MIADGHNLTFDGARNLGMYIWFLNVSFSFLFPLWVPFCLCAIYRYTILVLLPFTLLH